MKRVLITGITGQDGAYLAKFLLDKGYEVFGIYRRLSTPNFWRLQYLDIFDRLHLIGADLIDEGSLIEAIHISQPEEVYHLAAQSFVWSSFEEPISTAEMTGLGVTRILEAIRHVNRDIRFYQASTSELFGYSPEDEPLHEGSPFQPQSPYAAAKLYGYWITTIYRKGYGMYACNGILFNHESPLRGLEFITRKLSNAAARISLGLQKEISVGNLDAMRDWGFAPDYVESMWMMLQEDEPDDYVVATNESHSVREFAEKVFSRVGLDYRDHVKVDKKFLRPLDVRYLQGDYRKAREKLGWRPKVNFDDLVSLMVKADQERWKRWMNGEQFPWDAIHYPHENQFLSRSERITR
jgi:GDPmannose 4,6-dehydratase